MLARTWTPQDNIYDSPRVFDAKPHEHLPVCASCSCLQVFPMEGRRIAPQHKLLKGRYNGRLSSTFLRLHGLFRQWRQLRKTDEQLFRLCVVPEFFRARHWKMLWLG